jgi:uncharacterized membrane protein
VQRISRYELAGLAAILILAAGLRLWGLGSKSFWVDELLAVERSRSLRQAVADCAENHEPPLRYYLVHYLAQLHPPELFTRLPSYLLGVATIALLWWLVRALFGVGAAMASAVLLTLSPWHILQCQDARMYAVMMFFWTLSLVLFFGALEKPTQALRWPALAIVHDVNFYLSYLTVFVLAAEALTFGGWLVVRKWRARERFALKPYAVGALIFIGFFGAITAAWFQPLVALVARYTPLKVATAQPAITAMTAGIPVGWPAEFNAQFFAALLDHLLLPGWPWRVVTLVGLSAGLSLCWQRNRTFVWIAALSFFVAMAAILFTDMRNFVAPRYVFHLLLFFLVALAIAIVAPVEAILARARSKPLRTATAIVSAGIAGVAIYLAAPTLLIDIACERQDWRGACHYLAENAKPNGVILTGPWESHLAVLYYGEPALTKDHVIRNCLTAERMWREIEDAPADVGVWYVTWWANLPDEILVVLKTRMEPVVELPGLNGTIAIWKKRRPPETNTVAAP